MKQRRGRPKTKRRLPPNMEPAVKTAAIEMKRRPRPHEEGNKTVLNVDDGLLTVTNAGDSAELRNDMCIRLSHRRVVARKITISKGKCRGSESHNKFLVIIRSAVILNASKGGVAA